jgi:hypothetical protein
MDKMTKYKHMLDVAFTIVTEKKNWEDLTHEELLEALQRRVDDIRKRPLHNTQAYNHCDTYEIQDES